MIGSRVSITIIFFAMTLLPRQGFAQPADPARFFPGFNGLYDDAYCFQCVATDDEGNYLVAGQLGRSFAVVRMRSDGTPDPAFGRDGIVRMPVWGNAGDMATTVVALPDGRVVVAGNGRDFADPGCGHGRGCANFAAIFRLLRDGSPDPSFATDGRLVLRIGRLVSDEGTPLPGLFLEELDAFPSGDLGIMASGSYSTLPTRVAPDGTLYLSRPGTVEIFAVEFSVATEFYNEQLDRYFVTADPFESEQLDAVPGSPWQWTGNGFHVYPSRTHLEDSVPVCRFYGKPEAGLDTHFLTADAAECATLAAADRWILEASEAFRVALPDPSSGACPAGSGSVRRFWNAAAGVGHRYAVSDRFLPPLGYVPEGWGPLGVAMCSAP